MRKLIYATALTTLATGAAFANPYEPYAGTTLVVNFPSHPHYDAVMQVLPEFTAETGIEVEVDMLPYLDMRERQTLELALDEGAYDLIAYVVFSKADYVYADQVENLAKYFMNPRLADPNYDAGDLIDAYVQNIGVAGGEKGYLPGPTGSLYGLPFGAETSVLFYRKDIFDKHGLTVPETYDELLDLACRIPELEPGMGGVASRAASGHQASHAFLLHLAPLGGQVFDAAWNPTINNEAGVKAAEALKTIVDCGPEGSSAFGPAEAANAFAQGQAAMFLDFDRLCREFRGSVEKQRGRQCRLCDASDGRKAGQPDRWLRPRYPGQCRTQRGRLPADAMADRETGRSGRGDGGRQSVALLDLSGCRSEREISVVVDLWRGLGIR